jgi:hypothetical protein
VALGYTAYSPVPLAGSCSCFLFGRVLCTVHCALLGDIDDRWSSVERGDIGYRPIGRGLGARGSRIEGRGATKGDEWWERCRCSAGVHTLVWVRMVGWWLGPEGAEVEQCDEHNTVCGAVCFVRVRACVRVHVCCDERGQVGRCRCRCER